MLQLRPNCRPAGSPLHIGVAVCCEPPQILPILLVPFGSITLDHLMADVGNSHGVACVIDVTHGPTHLQVWT